MTFGERLKELRDKRKLTQTELADLASLHYTQIGRYEKAKTMPSPDVMKILIDAFLSKKKIKTIINPNNMKSA